MYLGAEVHRHPTILGFDDIQRGFSGCMDDIRISRISVPLHTSGDNSVAVLKRFANVEFSCDANDILTPPGPCGSQPCMNGALVEKRLTVTSAIAIQGLMGCYVNWILILVLLHHVCMEGNARQT